MRSGAEPQRRKIQNLTISPPAVAPMATSLARHIDARDAIVAAARRTSAAFAQELSLDRQTLRRRDLTHKVAFP